MGTYVSQVPAWVQLGVEAGGALRGWGVWRKCSKTVRAVLGGKGGGVDRSNNGWAEYKRRGLLG